MANVELTNAATVDIEVTQGDKLDSLNATITIVDADGVNIDMTQFSGVELNIYRDEDFKSRIYQFTNPASMTLGDGFFILLASPFTLQAGTYRYGLKETDSPLTLATGDFIVNPSY